MVIDEASMVDLALMTKLFSAVAPRARLILLGDKDQLASVEAGAVLGDICGAGLPHQETHRPPIAEPRRRRGPPLPTAARMAPGDVTRWSAQPPLH